MDKTCIIIAGPTAVGKTALSIELARHFSTSIISADSRQCYKELDIGVAKPSLQQLQQVPHYFINSHSIQETVNAGVFEKYALEKLQAIFAQNDIAIMVGGTGLYIKTFCSGIDEMPSIAEGTREEIERMYAAYGLGWLQDTVREKDPLYFSQGEVKNPQRLMRALEVMLSTGRSIVQFQKKNTAVRAFRIVKIGLELPRQELYRRINERVEIMMADGLLEEVKGLVAYRELTALQTVGYKELFDHLDGKISLQEAMAAIQLNTRHYAKRQMTWFKKDAEINWTGPSVEEVFQVVRRTVPGS